MEIYYLTIYIDEFVYFIIFIATPAGSADAGTEMHPWIYLRVGYPQPKGSPADGFLPNPHPHPHVPFLGEMKTIMLLLLHLFILNCTFF